MPTKSSSIYLFLAEEDFLKEEAVEKLKSKFLDNATRDLNYSVFYGRDRNFNVKEMLDSLNTMPFLSKRRMVVLKDADALTEPVRQSIISYLCNPKESSIFIIESRSGAIKGDFFLQASKHGNLFYFRPLTDQELTNWILKKASSYGKRISREAIQLIKESLPNDLRILSSAMENIALYTGKRSAISAKDAEEIVGVNPSHTAFDLIRKIEEKDAKRALYIFSSLQKSRKKETELLGLMAWHARMLLRVKELFRIKNKTEMRKDLGLNPRTFDQIARLAQGFKRSQILALLDEILLSDLEIKSGASPTMAIEKLIVKMCGY